MAIAMRPDKPIASKAIENASSRVTSELVWQKLSSGSFAVIGYVTPGGAPRSSGVVYTTVGKRLYTAVAPESWKARHIQQACLCDCPGAPRRHPLSCSAHTTCDHQLSRGSNRAPERLVEACLNFEAA